MVSSIERFHCIQDSQLGLNGVLYRKVPLYYTKDKHAPHGTNPFGCCFSDASLTSCSSLLLLWQSHLVQSMEGATAVISPHDFMSAAPPPRSESRPPQEKNNHRRKAGTSGRQAGRVCVLLCVSYKLRFLALKI